MGSIKVAVLFVVVFTVCRILWPGREISLFEVPGMRIKSLRFLHLERTMDLIEVDKSMIGQFFLKRDYPSADKFYRSEKLPIVIVEKNHAVEVVRVGEIGGGLREIGVNSYIISSDLLRRIARDLEKSNVRLPYELIVCTDKASAIRVFSEPYVAGPAAGITEGDAFCLDFTKSELAKSCPVVLYFVKDRLVGFEVRRLLQ